MSSTFFLSGTDLNTDRLVLRQWPTDDLDAALNDRRLVHWAEDFPAEGDRVIVGVIAQGPDAGGAYGHRQIVERASGLVVGSISLLWPPSDGSLEIGYGIVASRRGRGYAPEATQALVEFALTSPDTHSVYADAELSNPASIRVLEKAGLHRVSSNATTTRFSTQAPNLN
ncbi:GNAT family N-acetyltransferase [Streptomyces sp. 2A115]|uniref:GNAT family N-acetyltransferase n=1 Tax=Streptomyces sp. 2A115 TaxID=3457439 RepID=UPI003FCF1C74